MQMYRRMIIAILVIFICSCQERKRTGEGLKVLKVIDCKPYQCISLFDSEKDLRYLILVANPNDRFDYVTSSNIAKGGVFIDNIKHTGATPTLVVVKSDEIRINHCKLLNEHPGILHYGVEEFAALVHELKNEIESAKTIPVPKESESIE